MSRFDLSLGFGDKTVQEVCRENGVDCRTFLAVVNFMIEDSDRMEDDVKDISMPSLMNYLKQAHHYFLDFCLPTIRRKLIEAIDCSTENEVAFLILKFFDQYAGEVRKHMDYEDMNVFTYVENLMAVTIIGTITEWNTILLFDMTINHIQML
jgi:regulator of cell morphogenesis and NO signaling